LNEIFEYSEYLLTLNETQA